MVAAMAVPAPAQPGPDGIDWVTVGDVGNPAYAGPGGLVVGRGSVGYEYRVGRTEVTTAQWLEFYNTFKARADPVPDSVLPSPIIWGATIDPNYTGPGTRYMLQNDPDAGMRAVSGISWRMGAMLCNWLHNDKSSDITAYQNGAYDISTFGYSAPGVFTDQLTHHPEARYWIPTLDEYMKAVFYDPTRDGTGGWWQQPNMSDIPLVYGPPGVGMANSGFTLPQSGELRIPLMSYPDTHSYYGVLDSAGFTQEWIEDRYVVEGRTYRIFDGSYWSVFGPGIDTVHGFGADFPSMRYSRVGLRLASAVPASGTLPVLLLAGLVAGRRRTRETPPCSVPCSRFSRSSASPPVLRPRKSST
ncbi:MAG: hypothetical protein HBSAPP03_26860 [Phycisphaerae bacterium]|nr:MAG: hypothetical protein HBSAPP03_26860 [Phycisphaerae bacterium]